MPFDSRNPAPPRVRFLPTNPAMKMFRDHTDRRWTVFSVTPDAIAAGRADILPAPYTDGWLVFESDTERRRLAPLPHGWEQLDVDALRHLLDRAERVRFRHTSALPIRADDDAKAEPLRDSR